MLDAIQRMRRERRIALLIFVTFAVVALCAHWFSAPQAVPAPRSAPTETMK